MVCRLKSGRRKNILQKRTENRNIRYLCKTEQQNRTKAHAGESEEDNVPHTRGILSYRTNRNGLLQIRRVIDWWLPYQGLKNEVDYYISTINKELSTDNGYKRKNCLAKSGKDSLLTCQLNNLVDEYILRPRFGQIACAKSVIFAIGSKRGGLLPFFVFIEKRLGQYCLKM